jgi:WD40 repeat protein
VCEYAFEEHYSSIDGVKVMDETQLVAVASNLVIYKYQIGLFTLEDDGLRMVWCADGGGCYASCSPLYQSQFTVFGSLDSQWIDLWDLETRTLVKQYFRENGRVYCICALLGNTLEYVVGADRCMYIPCWMISVDTIVVYDRASGEQLALARAHTDEVFAVASHPKDPWQFVTCSKDASLIVHAFHVAKDVCVGGVSHPTTLKTFPQNESGRSHSHHRSMDA